jgi:YD repeat-containing protein
MKWNLMKLIGVAGVAVTLVGCPEMALKGVIRALAQPGNIASLKVSQGASNQFLLKWVDPSDADVDHIEISLKCPMSSDAPPAPVNVPVGVQSATVTVPFNNVQYAITVRSVDKAGNKSPGSVYSPISFMTAFQTLFGSSPVSFLPSAQKPAKFKFTYTAFPLSAATSEIAYLYDSITGNLTTLTNSSPPGTTTSSSTYTYDGRGNLTRQNNLNSLGTMTNYYTYTYDSNNNQLTNSYYNTPTTLYSQDQYQYDANGNQVRDTYYDSSLTEQYHWLNQYDSNGRLVSGGEYAPDGTPNYVYTVQWDQNTGYPASMVINDGAGNLYIGMGWVITGNTVVETAYSSSSSETITWTYDTHGLLQQITYAYSSTSYNYQYSYDSSGNLTQELDNTNSGGVFSRGYTWSY